MALKDDQSQLFPLFGKDLPNQYYRVFSSGHLILTVFADRTLVKTVSTEFEIEQNQVENVNALDEDKELSHAAAIALMKVPKVDLSKIAARMALPSCK